MKLPKVELHRHLDGSIRPETIWSIATKHNIELGIPNDGLNEALFVSTPAKSLDEVLSRFWISQKVMINFETMKQITFENIEDAHRDGVRLLELRFSPAFIQVNKELSVEEIFEGVLAGVRLGADKFPDLQVGLIFILVRSSPTDSFRTQLDIDNRNAFEALMRYLAHSNEAKNYFVGVDIASNETENQLYSELLTQAKAQGLGVTVHTGEALGPEVMREAIETYKMDRIGHGIAAVRDNHLCRQLKALNIHLEMCLTSNWLTASCPILAEHPIKKFLADGISVSLNSDDPQLMKIDLVHETWLAHKALGLSKEELWRLNVGALEYSFLDEDRKKYVRKKHFHV